MKPLTLEVFGTAAFVSALACGPTAPATEPATIVLPPQPPQPAPPPPPTPLPAPTPVAVAVPAFRCESGKRFEAGGRSYCGYAEPETWEASEARCVAGGGHLMTLDSGSTDEAVHAALGSPLGAGRAAWIGLELKTKGGHDWKWSTGEAVTAASWNSGEPNNFDRNEACGEWLVVDGRWNDTRCELRQPHLCQQSKPDKDLTCSGGRVFAAGGLEYCLHGSARTFAEAKRACTADGGRLAVLKTTEENRGLLDAMAARFAATRMWIGLSDSAEEGNWSWASGSKQDFAAWASGEPNNYNEEHCAELHGDTWKWNDLDCNAKLPSVCESPARSR